jgi:hypothetical protein
MFPDVVPLAESIRPGDPDCYEINPATLKYLEIEPEKAARLRAAGHVGAKNLRECKKRINRKDTYINSDVYLLGSGGINRCQTIKIEEL